MARFVFFNVPAHGHTNPTLPVVRNLVQQGHEVIYYNSAEFRDKVSATGVTFRAYPESALSSAAISEAVSGGDLVNVTLLLFRMSNDVLPFVLDELRREQPDVVIHDSIALWGAVAAQLVGLPTVASITHFVLKGTDRRPTPGEMWFLVRKALPRLPELVRLRRRLNRYYDHAVQRPDHRLPVRGDLNLMFTTSALQPASTWIDSSFRFVGPSIDATTRHGGDPELDYAHGEPLIYASLGTVHSANTAFYRQMFHAFASYPARIILSVGQQTDIASLGTISENFVVRNYVPQLDVLRHVDLFITHGGMNSIHEGLFYGVPLVMVPQQMEQVLNARVVAANGAGVVVGDRPPFGRVTETDLRMVVDWVLHDDQFRQQATAIGESLQAAGGYAQAADEIVNFARQVTNANEMLMQVG